MFDKSRTTSPGTYTKKTLKTHVSLWTKIESKPLKLFWYWVIEKKKDKKYERQSDRWGLWERQQLEHSSSSQKELTWHREEVGFWFWIGDKTLAATLKPFSNVYYFLDDGRDGKLWTGRDYFRSSLSDSYLNWNRTDNWFESWNSYHVLKQSKLNRTEPKSKSKPC